MSTTIPTRPRRHRARAVAIGAVVATVFVVGASCSSDSDTSSSTTTTAESGATTTSTTTTLPGNQPTVSEIYAPPVADSGSGTSAKVYLSITGGAEVDSLVGVTVAPDVAASAKLTPAAEVEVPATQTVNLDPDTNYIELTDLAAPLELNRGFKITLDFATGPDQEVEVVVRDPS